MDCSRRPYWFRWADYPGAWYAETYGVGSELILRELLVATLRRDGVVVENSWGVGRGARDGLYTVFVGVKRTLAETEGCPGPEAFYFWPLEWWRKWRWDNSLRRKAMAEGGGRR